nr:hypothetical protein [Gryllotalpicola protaetiae]
MKSDTSVHPASAPFELPAYVGTGRPAARARYRDAPIRASALAAALPDAAFQDVSWRRERKGS